MSVYILHNQLKYEAFLERIFLKVLSLLLSHLPLSRWNNNNNNFIYRINSAQERLFRK